MHVLQGVRLLLQLRLQNGVVHQVDAGHSTNNHVGRLVGHVIAVVVLAQSSSRAAHHRRADDGVDVIQVATSVVLVQSVCLVYGLAAGLVGGVASHMLRRRPSDRRVHELAVLSCSYIVRAGERLLSRHEGGIPCATSALPPHLDLVCTDRSLRNHHGALCFALWDPASRDLSTLANHLLIGEITVFRTLHLPVLGQTLLRNQRQVVLLAYVGAVVGVCSHLGVALQLVGLLENVLSVLHHYVLLILHGLRTLLLDLLGRREHVLSDWNFVLVDSLRILVGGHVIQIDFVDV